MGRRPKTTGGIQMSDLHRFVYFDLLLGGGRWPSGARRNPRAAKCASVVQRGDADYKAAR